MLETVSFPVGSVGALTGASGAIQTPQMAQTGGTAAGQDFMAMLNQVAGETVTSLRQGEAASIQGLQGKASVQDVVNAVMTAERSLQTTLAVRDKIVSAFQEISRMAI